MRKHLTAIIAALGLGVALPAAAPAQQTRPGPSTPAPADAPDAFGQRVRAYLLAHPEVIMEAVQLLQERRAAAQAEVVKKEIMARADEIFRDTASPVGGNASGDVTLVEFFDYNCKYCRAVAPTINEVRRAEPGLRLVYKEFPILGPGSEAAARAALAAQRQGKYHELHRELMSVETPLTEEKALRAAAALGLDTERLKRDMADPALAETIARNQALAAALGIDGTPGFVIGDQVVPGALDRAALEGLIAKARAEPLAATR